MSDFDVDQVAKDAPKDVAQHSSSDRDEDASTEEPGLDQRISKSEAGQEKKAGDDVEKALGVGHPEQRREES
jgi:hypothetical protein